MKRTKETVNRRVDFMLPWVDGNSSDWLANFNRYYTPHEDELMNGRERYHSSVELLKLWIQGALFFADWVTKIYIIVDRKSLRDVEFCSDFDKVEVVCHDQFIPGKYLPTFNSNVIEMFVDEIDGLADQFVLFNDDCFITDYISYSDFFSKLGVPLDVDEVYPSNSNKHYGHILLNNLILINNVFDFKKYQKEYVHKKVRSIINRKVIKSIALIMMFRYFHGWVDEHMPMPYCKNDFRRAWQLYPNVREKQGERRFRSKSDVSHLLIRFTRLASGDYISAKTGRLGVYTDLNPDSYKKNVEESLADSPKIVCVNDYAMSQDLADNIYKYLTRTLSDYYVRQESLR